MLGRDHGPEDDRCEAERLSLVRAGVHFEDGVQIEPQKKRRKKAAA